MLLKFYLKYKNKIPSFLVISIRRLTFENTQRRKKKHSFYFNVALICWHICFYCEIVCRNSFHQRYGRTNGYLCEWVEIQKKWENLFQTIMYLLKLSFYEYFHSVQVRSGTFNHHCVALVKGIHYLILLISKIKNDV